MRRSTQFNILLIEPDPDLAGAVSFALHSQFGATVFECENRASAQDFLSHVSNLDLLILPAEVMNDPALLDPIGSNGKPISIILNVETNLSNPALMISPGILGVARTKALIDDVLDLVRKNFFHGEMIEGLEDSDFCQINPRLLLKIFPLAADVYIRISEGKHLKMFSKGSHFDPSDFERYATQKGIEHFYVKRSDSQALLDRLRSEVQATINREPPDSEAIYELMSDISESVHDMVTSVGVTEEVREMTRSNMDLVLRLANKNPNLEQVLTDLHPKRDGYITQHSLALSQVSCALASKVGWVSDVTFQKLILASLFHDITVKNPAMARLRNLSELMNHKEWVFMESAEDIKLHPVRAAELVQQLGSVLPDVEVIVRQHHERPDGKGFPFGIGHAKFTPLSALFVVAQDFLDFYEKLEASQKSSALKDFLSKSANEYQFGHFRQLHRELSLKTG